MLRHSGCIFTDNLAMFYTVRPPFFLPWYYTGACWRMPAVPNEVFLTFDDGPHPEITPFVLEQLRRYNAKASFFCIGNNVRKYPQVAQAILDEGHTIGNHTYDHLDGWSTPAGEYLENIAKAGEWISGNLFRPPYGRITRKQLRLLREQRPDIRVVMWDVLSGDFDQRLDGAACYRNVRGSVRAGSIVVFHDSEKAFPRLKVALPLVLDKLNKKSHLYKSL